MIFGGDIHKTEVEGFFKEVGPDWKVEKIEPGPVVTELDTGVRIPLYRAITTSCTQGAIIHLVRDPSGDFLLDWPLFSETHHKGPGVSLEGDPWEARPVWKTLLIQRGRSELPAEKKDGETYENVRLKAGLWDAEVVEAYVRADSSVGRLLSSRLTQDQFGLAKLLLSSVKIAGRRVPVVEDYETARTAQR
jgi:hypothetical protein